MLKLNCQVQNYAWGRPAEKSLVATIASSQGQQIESSKPYAEWWVGDHVNGPSSILIDNQNPLQQHLLPQDFLNQNHQQLVSISNLLKISPDLFLGPGVQEKYPFSKQSLPFLFKVLSVNQALSIQAHPNRKMAEQLNLQQPNVYKDPNPKPEVAIALSDDFRALFGFLPIENLRQQFVENQSLNSLLQETGMDVNSATFVKDWCNFLFNKLDHNKPVLKEVTTGLHQQISSSQSKTDHQMLFLELVSQYGFEDIGVLFAFLMNICRPKKSEWFFIDANVPHCYLQGELIEIMVNSDNVIRGGLTPKLKDVKTLLEVLPYDDTAERKIDTGKSFSQEMPYRLDYYPEGFNELHVTKVDLVKDQIYLMCVQYCAVVQVVHGSGEFKSQYVNGEVQEYSTWYVIPRQEVKIKCTSDHMTIFIADPL